MQPKRAQTKPIPKQLQDDFFDCMWELAMTGRFYRKVDPSAFVATESFFHSFGSGKRASVLVSQRHGLVILWSTAAALRFNELAHLKLTDVDTHQSTVYVRRSKKSESGNIPIDPMLIDCTTSWHRALSAKIAEQSRRMPDPEKYVASVTSVLLLPNEKGRMLNNKIFNRDVCEPLGEIFGIKLSHHCFRDTACDRTYTAGVDPRSVQLMMGHKSARTTEIYARKSAPLPIQVPLFSGGKHGQ